MKKRPDGFLAEGNIDHNSEIFDYIKELHTEMWKIIFYFDCQISPELDICWDFLINTIIREKKIKEAQTSVIDYNGSEFYKYK